MLFRIEGGTGVFVQPRRSDLFSRHREPPHGTYAEVECFSFSRHREPLHGKLTYAEVEVFIHREPPHVTYINTCLPKIRNLKFQPAKKSNLLPNESAALISLQKRDDIVIKPADKGGAVVVWDLILYIEKAYKQLDNPTNYQKTKRETRLFRWTREKSPRL